MAGDDDIRRLGKYEVGEIFRDPELPGPVLITPEAPVLGELIFDVDGRIFLTPEPEERGGPGGAVRVHGVSLAVCSEYLDELVLVAGRYDVAEGFHVTHIGREGEVPRPVDA